MYSRIVVPVDGSSFSEHAIAYAGAIAQRAGARLTVVLVHSPLARYAASLAPTPLFEEWESRHRQQEAAYLEQLVGRLQDRGLRAFAERLEGEVAHSLIERVESDADLLVMATHGRAGLERAWLGSVADEVVHHVKLPVLLVRPQSELAPRDVSFKHVVAATDGSQAAAAAVGQAVEVARLFEAQLTLLRVVSVPAGLSSPYLPHAAAMDREITERRKQEAEAFLEKLAEELDCGATVKARVPLAYHPARGILDAIDDFGCDLVVVGTRRHTRLARIFLGSVADKVARASDVPVLIAHSDE
ncbi:MAG: universal stress protein [Gemmatimonadales bacterium]|jgi:nucleotide-binding universal stress UspA family protein